MSLAIAGWLSSASCRDELCEVAFGSADLTSQLVGSAEANARCAIRLAILTSVSRPMYLYLEDCRSKALLRRGCQ